MRKAVDFINVLASVLLGLYLTVLAVSRSGRLLAIPEWLTSSGIIIVCFLAGILLVVANAKVLADEWKAGGLRRNLRITTDSGQNELSVAALELLILNDLGTQSDIVDPIITLQPRAEGKPMLCLFELKLRRQPDIIKRIDAVKHQIRDVFDSLIPGGLTVEVQAEVRGIVEDASKPRSGGDGQSEFNGPVYADGDIGQI